MKIKIIAILLAFVMGLSLCACGNTTATTDTDKTNTETTTANQNTNEDGTLSAPSFKGEDTPVYENDKVPDLNSAEDMIASFKRSNPLTENHPMGQAFIDSGLYNSQDDFPTFSDIFSNMIDDVKYEYDTNTHYITASGDLDTASLNTLSKYVADIDNHFGFYDRLYFTGEWEFYKVNSSANGINMNYATLATVDQYGETPLEFYISMIMLCSEMKNGKISWDQASDIYDEFIQLFCDTYGY